jgi:hypothetical protein
MIYAENAATCRRRAQPHPQVEAAVPGRDRQPRRGSDELFTFLCFPASQWRVSGNSPPHQEAVHPAEPRLRPAAPLCLLRSGAVKLRALDEWKDMPKGDQEAAQSRAQMMRLCFSIT